LIASPKGRVQQITTDLVHLAIQNISMALLVAEMPPVFKNTHVSRDDIGDHTKTFAEERGIMTRKRKCLIGSM
jgi:hypothetical protein